jgi:hypothetical protein
MVGARSLFKRARRREPLGRGGPAWGCHVEAREEGKGSLILNLKEFQWISNENLGNSRSIFEFRKLIKIAKNGLKFQELVWR